MADDESVNDFLSCFRLTDAISFLDLISRVDAIMMGLATTPLISSYTTNVLPVDHRHFTSFRIASHP